jgi:hypothetical protein
MKKSFSFSISSRHPVELFSVWSHISSMKGVNYELMPYIRMTYPKNRESIAASDTSLFKPGETVFLSLILLFGCIPFDLHWLCFDSIEIGTGFHENSVTLLNSMWKHRRLLTQYRNYVEIRDEVEFSPRLPVMGYILLPIVRFIFGRRHEKLEALFRERTLSV